METSPTAATTRLTLRPLNRPSEPMPPEAPPPPRKASRAPAPSCIAEDEGRMVCHEYLGHPLNYIALRDGESRRDYLTRAAIAYIRRNCPDSTIGYDAAECDGTCLADELESELSNP